MNRSGSASGRRPQSARNSPAQGRAQNGKSSFGGWLGTLAKVAGILAVFVAAFELYRHISEVRDAARREELRVEAQAFTLGRRTSVYESTREWLEEVGSRAGTTDSLAGQIALGKTAEEFAGGDMAKAAEALAINLDPREELWILDRKISGQLSDKFKPAVPIAYKLGRQLGYHDERSFVLYLVSEKGGQFPLLGHLSNGHAFAEWLAEVDSMLRAIGAPRDVAAIGRDDTWSRLAVGRALLESVAEWFVEPTDRARRATAVDKNWVFAILLMRDAGAPQGYSAVLETVPITSTSSDEFASAFRQRAWLPELPEEAIIGQSPSISTGH
jgi:hypothetical protein